MPRRVLKTKLCAILGIEYPILLAGMGVLGRATPPRLVAAVSNAGGLGIAACSQNDPEFVRQRIREIKALTGKPFGMNVLFPGKAEEMGNPEDIYHRLQKEYPRHVEFVHNLMNELGLPVYEFKDWDPRFKGTYSWEVARKQVEVILEENVPVLSAGLGVPADIVGMAHARGMKVLGTAGSVRNAVRHVEAGVDIVVAQGYEAGGHTGTVATLPLVLSVVAAVSPVPVVAAGGIASGQGLVAALALGAVGAWCGTAFLLAEESNIYPEHQQAIIEGHAEDWTVTRCYTGKTARHYRNRVIEAWTKSGLPVLPMPYETVLFNQLLNSAEKHYRPEYIYNAAGQIVNILRERQPAAKIITDMIEEAEQTLDRLGNIERR